MLSNYVKILLRNFRKNKFFSAVNIFGLSLGLACCMLVALFIAEETNFDRFHPRADDLYAVGRQSFKLQGDAVVEEFDPNFDTSSPLADLASREVPEVEKAARIMPVLDREKTLMRSVENGAIGKASNEVKGYFADSTFFELFHFDFIEGDPARALNAPGTVVLSEEIARKFFGTEPAYGRTLRISSEWFTGGDLDLRVTGVYRMPGQPSHLDGRFYMSLHSGEMSEFIKNNNQDLVNNSIFVTYFRLRPGADRAVAEQKLAALQDRYAGAQAKAMGFAVRPFLVGVPQMHLSGVEGPGRQGRSRTYLYMLASIAVFTLLIACVNFMNLSTARSARRAGEVGVRKAIGATRRKLIGQFLGESLAIALAAFVVAVVLAWIGLPFFNQLAGSTLSVSFFEYPATWAGFLALTVCTGLLAGLYPAFFLASFRPVEVLKGKLANNLSATLLRRGLVVFQFFISAGLILASLVIQRQMGFLQSKDLGFHSDQQIVIPLLSKDALAAYGPLKAALEQDSRIVETGASTSYPGLNSVPSWVMHRYGQAVDQTVSVRQNWVDDGFLPALGIEAVAGRLYSYRHASDSLSKLVLNETAVRKFGFASPAEAIGQSIGFQWEDTVYRYEVLGVVRDFHSHSLHEAIEPYAFRLARRPQFNYLIARANTSDLPNLLRSIEATWRGLVPGEPLEYSFLDEDFQKNYEADRRTAGLISAFTGIAIVIACLGLFGLATFAAERRTREIGIRKVLGASVAGITGLLARDFLRLVVAGIVLATPLAWWAMRRWLDDFAYRIEISGWMFFAAAALVMGIAFVTVGYQSLKAALGNPVRALRSE